MSEKIKEIKTVKNTFIRFMEEHLLDSKMATFDDGRSVRVKKGITLPDGDKLKVGDRFLVESNDGRSESYYCVKEGCDLSLLLVNEKVIHKQIIITFDERGVTKEYVG